MSFPLRSDQNRVTKEQVFQVTPTEYNSEGLNGLGERFLKMALVKKIDEFIEAVQPEGDVYITLTLETHK